MLGNKVYKGWEWLGTMGICDENGAEVWTSRETRLSEQVSDIRDDVLDGSGADKFAIKTLLKPQLSLSLRLGLTV